MITIKILKFKTHKLICLLVPIYFYFTYLHDNFVITCIIHKDFTKNVLLFVYQT